MKKLIILSTAIFLFACNNEKKPASADSDKIVNGEPPAPSLETTTADYTSTTNLTYSVDGKEIKHSASLLVTKDKDKLQAGVAFFCMLTSNSAAGNNESVTVNFLLDTKPGTYPVVGRSFQRGKNADGELFGSILGGKPTLTEYKVTITECKDLGDNNIGGHKWSISGYWDPMPIKAMPVMLMDKTKNHPAEVQLGKGTFTNLTFDDNWEEMMEKAMDKMKKKG